MFDPELYVAAVAFAADRHHAQLVPGSRLPYLVHVVSVAAEVIAALSDTDLDPDLAVQCALLHDTIEDTQTTHAEIAERFGIAVANGVQALSKDGTLAKAEQMADSLRRIHEQPKAVWAVKLADRITNLAPPPRHWTKGKCSAYRVQAREILDALGEANAVLAKRMHDRIEAYRAYC